MMLAANAMAASVVIVLSEDSAPYQEVTERIRAGFAGLGNEAPVLRVLQAQSLQAGDGAFTAADLVVPVGVRAVETVAKLKLHAPVFSVLAPKSAVDQIAKEHPALDTRTFSALYLDQPAVRRMALIRQALPGRKRVGVLLGPESSDALRALQAAAREQGLSLEIERVASAEELLPALKRVLAESDTLLVLPDAQIVNKNTAQSILLTSYRAQDPVVAYSKSYVSAGALAAVYSTPAQIGQQAAELLARMVQAKPLALPPPQYPKYFSVSINYQVARSLGLAIEDEAVLLQRIKAGTERD
ncbi:MAG: hypothetical protein HZA59_11850 [Hydrogenophilales bacterium]|nr:hypothetical protein [Hydrogenophilales bacterium]